MEVLMNDLNECGNRLVRQLYNGKNLSIEGAPKLVWDWSSVRIRGTSGATGSYSKSYGITQTDFAKRMRNEEDLSRVRPQKVTKAKPSSMKNASLASPSWESFMSLANSMKYWSEPGTASPMKKRSRTDRNGRLLLCKET